MCQYEKDRNNTCKAHKVMAGRHMKCEAGSVLITYITFGSSKFPLLV